MLVSDTAIKAVSWVLVHSLWQGIVLAVCAGLVILVTKKSVAALRYNLLSALFVIFLFTVGLTFNYEFTPSNIDTITRINIPILHEQINSEFAPTDAADFSNIAINFFNNNANFIVMLWLIVFAFKLFGIFNAFGNVYRIRNYKTFQPSQYWKNKISDLALLMQIKKPIVLLESALVKIPSVTGFFRPIICVPIGMFSNLPHDQVEAILLHELAHVRRKDYIINLLQHLAEIIFFFNPGLLWISSLIKDERENCCDDIALQIIGNKTHFVHALISFEEYNTEKLVVAFAGKKNHLLYRVKRIIYNDNKSLNTIEKTFLSLSLLMIAVILIACANPQKTAALRNEIKELKPVNENQQLNVNPETLRELSDTNSYEEINPINENDLIYNAVSLFTPPVNQINTEGSMIYTVLNKDELADPVCVPVSVCTVVPAEPVEQLEISNTNSVTTRTTNATTKTSHHLEIEETVFDSANPKNNKHITLRTGVSGKNLTDDIDVDNLNRNIMSDLINKNIIKSTEGLSYMLSDNVLIVNDLKQCKTIHAQFKSKYLNTKSYTICYNYDYSGDQHTINK
ncbi:MAG: M56 family metallopeptidase [Flavobacterium sp.]|nr:M56 family metallopeptidase [Flavobacterium sp.]